MRVLRRLVVMAILGALGAGFGAAGGEALFLGSTEERAPASREICLVFDLSESMLKKTANGESQLEALRGAAVGFLSAQAIEGNVVSLVGFSSEARLLREPAKAEVVRQALDGLRAGGATDIARGLDMARDVLARGEAEESWILLFTDGKPQSRHTRNPAEEARRAARDCRESGIDIVAVGTGFADRVLLEEITGDSGSVFVSAPEALGEAFKSSVDRIQNRQMLASQPTAIDFEGSLRRACLWAALVGLGTGLALVFGHNRHLHRRLTFTQLALVFIGASASGFVAGISGQGLFYLLSEAESLQPVLRTVAWMVLGSGMVLGMSFFVPNLPRVRALLGGAVGGGAAVACFLRIVPEVGDTPGRLLGAAILGLMAGAMTVLVEASARKGWLVVHWPHGETSSLLLGAAPIVVGRTASAHICPSYDEELEPVIGVFTRGDQGIRFDDKRTGKRRSVRAGDRLTFGPVVVEVCEGPGEDDPLPSHPEQESGPSDASRMESSRRKPPAPLPHGRDHRTSTSRR